MIRPAVEDDIPAIVGMVKDLRASTKIPMEIDEAVTARTLRMLIAAPHGLLLVSGDHPQAFLAASVGVTAVSLAPVAMEHGWWASPDARGAGMRLLVAYEGWAEQMGCRYVRMCTPPHNERAATLLRRRGFSVSEMVWTKAL
jgi:GNAT superfamily N-acetyltransferase